MFKNRIKPSRLRSFGFEKDAYLGLFFFFSYIEHKEEIKLALLKIIWNSQVCKCTLKAVILILAGFDSVYLTTDLWMLTEHGIKEIAW